MKFKKIDFDEKLPFTQHLFEIRYRLIRILIFLGILFVACFSLSEQIFEILRAPIEGYNLIFISPTEAFFVHLKLAFFSALALSAPFIFYHIWAFVCPGLHIKERNYTLPFVILASIFFVVGVLFSYFFILPLGLHFLLTYKTSGILPNITIGNYIAFTLQLSLVFGIVFEFPLIAVFLTKIGILKPVLLAKNRKYAILIIFIVSAILTPPDVVTQILMVVPLLILYEISVISCSLIYKDKKKETDKAPKKKRAHEGQ